MSDRPLLHSDGRVNGNDGEKCGLTVTRAETGMASKFVVVGSIN